MLCYLVALLSQSTVCSLIASTLAILRWVSGIEVYICAGEAMYWYFSRCMHSVSFGFLASSIFNCDWDWGATCYHI